MLQFNWGVAVTVYIVLQLQWILGAAGAAHDGLLTVGQMRRHHADQGIPYLQHYGMWNDAVFIHLLCAAIAGFFAASWVSIFPHLGLLAAVVVACFSLSYGVNKAWVKGPTVQAQGWDGTLLSAGWVHVFQMTVIVFIFVMSAVSFLVLWSMDMMPLMFFLGCLSLLLAHACIGWHWPLRIFRQEWSPFEESVGAWFVASLYILFTIAAGAFFLSPLVS